MGKEQKLIEQLKKAVEDLNQCSSRLAESDIFVYLRIKSRDNNRQGDQIEINDVILHKSLLKEPADNDSQ